MKKIHDDLKTNQGIKDPIAHFCKTLKNQIDILFLDEFNITDITDAMIMQKILINLDNKDEEVFVWDEYHYGEWPLDPRRKEIKSILKNINKIVLE